STHNLCSPVHKAANHWPERPPGAVRIPLSSSKHWAFSIYFVLFACVVSSVLGCGFQKEEASDALDDICDSLSDVVTRNGDLVHVRWIHSHPVAARYCNGPDPNHSRTQPHLGVAMNNTHEDLIP